MSNETRPSERIVQQRMRNRVIEALEALAAGDEGVRSRGVVDYVEEFFDWIDDRVPWRWRTWSVFTANEVEGLGEIHDLLVQACDATPDILHDTEAFIRSGWPARIQPLARAPLECMNDRGRFSEEREEIEPGVPQSL